MRLPSTKQSVGGPTPPTPFPVSGGLVGDPIPAVYIGDGCRIYNNVQRAEGGPGIKTRPGWWRTLTSKLFAAASSVTVTNPNFGSDIAGWTAQDAAWTSDDGGGARIAYDGSVPASGEGYIAQEIDLIPGRLYRITFTVRNIAGTGNTVKVRLGTLAAGLNDPGSGESAAISTNGSKSVDLYAGNGSWLSFIGKVATSGQTVDIDNITVSLLSRKKVLAFKAMDGYGVEGTGVAWVDHVLGSPDYRLLALGLNKDLPPEAVGSTWNPSTTPVFDLSGFVGGGQGFHRLTAHEYPPRPITFEGRTHFIEKFNVPMTLQGGAFRESVPNAPARKPILIVASDLDEPCNKVHGSTAAETVTAVSGNATVAFKNTFPTDYPTWGPNDEGYNQVEILSKVIYDKLCYQNKYFRFVDAGRPHSPQVNPPHAGYAMEQGRYIYRVTYLVTCFEPPSFVGSGTDDIVVMGDYTQTVDHTIDIRVKAGGTTFEYRIDGGAYTGAIAISATEPQAVIYGLRLRWESTGTHTAGDVWTIEAHLVGESLGGDPSEIISAYDQSTPNQAGWYADVYNIPRGPLGVGGRRIYRSAPGPAFQITHGHVQPDEVGDEGVDITDGRVPLGTHKWVYSHVVQGRGETPYSPIAHIASENKEKPVSYKIDSLNPPPVFAIFETNGGTLDDLVVRADDGATGNGFYSWGDRSKQADDWRFEVEIDALGPATYRWRKNDGAWSVSAALPTTETALSDNINIVFSSTTSTGRAVGDKWVIDRAHNVTSRRFYRSDNDGPFRYVGSLDNPYEDLFVDNVPTDQLGPEAPKLEDLKLWLQATINENTDNSLTDITITLADGSSKHVQASRDIVRTFNLGAELSKVPQPINHNRVRVYFRKKDTDQAPGSILEANSLALIFAAAEGLEGELKQVPIDRAVMAGDWQYLDLLWSHGSFEARSWGFQILKRDKTLASGTPNPIFQFGSIYVDRGKYGPFTGTIQARFSWRDKETDVESDSSLPSATLDCGENPSGITMFPLGYRGFWDNTSGAWADDPVGMNLPPRGITRINAYVAYLRWGVGADNQGEFHVAAQDVAYPALVTDTPDQWQERAISIGNKDSPFLGNNDTYTIGSTRFTPDTLESQNLVRLEASAENAAKDIIELRAAEPLHDFKGRPRSCELALLDGDQIVMARETDYSMGTITVQKYKDIAVYTPSSGNAAEKLMDWMEGRLFTIQSDDKDYGNPDGHFETRQRNFVVQKVASNFHFYFGSQREAQTQDFSERFYGASGTYDWLLKGNRTSIFWTTKTTRLSSNPDYMAVINEMPLPIQDDEITAIGFAGEWLLIWTKKELYRSLKNRLVFDDGEDQVYTTPEAIKGAPGCIAPRSVIEIPGGRSMWLTPDFRIAIGNAAGFEYFEGRDPNRPISFRYEQWIKDNVDPELARFAHATYDKTNGWYELYFIARDAGDNCYADGSEFDDAALETDFYYRLTLDMRRNVIYTSDRCPMTCSFPVSKECVELGDIPGKVITGERYGYLYEMNPAKALSRGMPLATFRFTVASYAAPVITLNESTLPTDGDGIKDLEIWVVTSSGIEVRQVASNTANTITLYTNLTGTPATNAVVRVGPIQATVRGREHRYIWPACIEQFLIDAQDSNPDVPTTFVPTVYTAEGGKIQGATTAAATLSVDPATFARPGDGSTSMRRKGSRALTPEISWIQEQATTPVQVDAVHVFVRIQEGETGRDL